MYPADHFALRADGIWLQFMKELSNGDKAFAPQQGSMIFMQYTGLKDRNGVEIYERDIVRIGGNGSPLIFVIEYKAEWAGFIGKHVANEKRTRFADIIANDISEVVGNIYENPELLKREVR